MDIKKRIEALEREREAREFRLDVVTVRDIGELNRLAERGARIVKVLRPGLWEEL